MSDMRTPEPASFPDQFETSSRTTAIDSSTSTLTTRGWMSGAGPIEQELRSNRELIAGVPEERSLGMKRRRHYFAVALFAAFYVELQRFQNLIVFRE